MDKLLTWLKENWNTLVAVAAFVLSLMNYSKQLLYGHNLQLIVEEGMEVVDSPDPNRAPRLLILPSQLILINNGERSEIFLSSTLIVGTPIAGEKQLFCKSNQGNYQPAIIDAHDIHMIPYGDALSQFQDLAKADDADAVGQTKYDPEMEIGLKLVYLNDRREITTATVRVGHVSVDPKTQEFVNSEVANFETPLTVIGLKPSPFGGAFVQWFYLSPFVDSASTMNCSPDSFRPFTPMPSNSKEGRRGRNSGTERHVAH